MAQRFLSLSAAFNDFEIIILAIELGIVRLLVVLLCARFHAG